MDHPFDKPVLDAGQALVILSHRRHDLTGQVDVAHEVEVEDGAPILLRRFPQWAPTVSSDVVDDGVDRPDLVDDLGEQASPVRVRGQVGDDRENDAAGVSDFRRGIPQSRLAASATRIPASDNASATALPMPEEAPVTIAFFPRHLSILLIAASFHPAFLVIQLFTS